MATHVLLLSDNFWENASIKCSFSGVFQRRNRTFQVTQVTMLFFGTSHMADYLLLS